MSGKNQWLVADEAVEFEEKTVEVQDFRKFTDYFRGIYRIYLKYEYTSLGSWPTMPKNFRALLGVQGQRLSTACIVSLLYIFSQMLW